ncbi:uncharacterized protein METZ01_LOCUS451874, partial [marine metagenome]
VSRDDQCVISQRKQTVLNGHFNFIETATRQVRATNTHLKQSIASNQ